MDTKQNEAPFNNENDARNWIQKTFGLKPKQETDSTPPGNEFKKVLNKQTKLIIASADQTKNLMEAMAALQNEISALQTDYKNFREELNQLKESPGAEPAATQRPTDGTQTDEAYISIPENASPKEQYDAFVRAIDEYKNSNN